VHGSQSLQETESEGETIPMMITITEKQPGGKLLNLDT
jgi:hypothetical protein